MKFLAMHITNEKLSFDIFTVGNSQNILIFTEYLKDFWHKPKIYNFEPNNALLAITTNIPVLLRTVFVDQGHKYYWPKNPLNCIL